MKDKNKKKADVDEKDLKNWKELVAKIFLNCPIVYLFLSVYLFICLSVCPSITNPYPLCSSQSATYPRLQSSIDQLVHFIYLSIYFIPQRSIPNEALWSLAQESAALAQNVHHASFPSSFSDLSVCTSFVTDQPKRAKSYRMKWGGRKGSRANGIFQIIYSPRVPSFFCIKNLKGIYNSEKIFFNFKNGKNRRVNKHLC